MHVQPGSNPVRYSYSSALSASEKVSWTVEDLIGGDRVLDFSRPFLPESLARAAGLDFLTAEERLWVNQIRAHGYLYTFGLVEEFILPFVMDHVREDLASDDHRTRAFLVFAEEEAKHIHLFKCFREAFHAGFGGSCEVIGPAADIAAAVLAHDRLSVALLILHIEWMTQRHFIDSVRDDQDLDPQFRSLLRHHWMEEAQHARLDTNMVLELARDQDSAAIEKAVDGYLELGALIDGGLEQQARFDLEALVRRSGAGLTEAETERYLREQHQALRWTFIGTGITHPEFLRTVGELSTAQRDRLEEIAPAFC